MFYLSPFPSPFSVLHKIKDYLTATLEDSVFFLDTLKPVQLPPSLPKFKQFDISNCHYLVTIFKLPFDGSFITLGSTALAVIKLESEN
jgi:hypothetical protein